MTDCMLIPQRLVAPASEPFIQVPPPATCILSSCHFAARGLTALLKGNGGRTGRIRILVPADLSVGAEAEPTWELPVDSRLIVFIPHVPLEALRILKLLAQLLDRLGQPTSVCILSHFSPAWLYRTLLRLTGRAALLAGIMATRADLPCQRLPEFISSRSNAFPLRDQAIAEERRIGYRAEGLTRRELEAVLEYLSGRQIKSRIGVSAKTLYTQRLAGLRKLVAQLPSMSGKLPGRHRAHFHRVADIAISPEEQELIRALHNGQVFPVFQPVVDRNMQIQGFEVLTRWLHNGRVVPPAEFLPLIRTRETWLLLTAFVMNVAVQRINQFGGRLYFTVNVPPCVAESGALLRMAETARKQLKVPDWVNLLVPEFAETTDLSRDERALGTIRDMVEAGYRVFLDDCFSAGSVMFPVRQAQFSGYKLDMSLVSAFLQNLHDENLIRGLVYYCRLTGSQCIAEGVDSREKFSALADIGVDSFQGFYISPPVLADELEYTARRLSCS